MEGSDAEMSEAGQWLKGAARATPEGENGAALERWLDGMDEARWKTLLALLEAIATQTAPRFGDVADADDVFGELVLQTCDRWLPRFREELRAGKARTPLWTFLKLRLAGHLSEMRRKRRRRDQLIRAEVGPWSAGEEEGVILAAERPAGPREELFARELADLAARDPELRQVLEMRYAGHSQEEIAGALAVSRPTISRRLGMIAALAATLLVIAVATWWALRPGPAGEPPSLVPESPTLPPPPQPAASPEETEMPLELSDAQIREVVLAADSGFGECLALEAGPGAREFRVAVAPDGIGSDDVRAAGNDRHRHLMPCIRQAAQSWRFPAARRESVSTFWVPLEEPPADADALACAARSDHECVVRLLGRLHPSLMDDPDQRVRSLTELTMLLEAYRALGDDTRLAFVVNEVHFNYPNSATAFAETDRAARERPADPPSEAHSPSSPEPAESPAASRLERATQCSMRGDNACVIDLLAGRASNPRQHALLIEAYRARGQMSHARDEMEAVVRRFPTSSQARMYRQILARL